MDFILNNLAYISVGIMILMVILSFPKNKAISKLYISGICVMLVGVFDFFTNNIYGGCIFYVVGVVLLTISKNK